MKFGLFRRKKAPSRKQNPDLSDLSGRLPRELLDRERERTPVSFIAPIPLAQHQADKASLLTADMIPSPLQYQRAHPLSGRAANMVEPRTAHPRLGLLGQREVVRPVPAKESLGPSKIKRPRGLMSGDFRMQSGPSLACRAHCACDDCVSKAVSQPLLRQTRPSLRPLSAGLARR
jgi:hypothetical protein